METLQTMTEKQRIRRCIDFEKTDRVPWQINYTTQMAARLIEAFAIRTPSPRSKADGVHKYEELDAFLGNHIAYARNRGVASVREISAGIWQDEWGVLWDRRIDGDIGTPVNCPLESGDLADLSLPDPDAPERYAHFRPIIESNRHRYILAKFSYSLFERAWSLRGMENLLVDFTLSPAQVHDLMRAICDFNLSIIRNLAEFPIDGIYFGDDWGSQKAMLMSPEMWRVFIKPYLKEMYQLAHQQGYDVFIHSCGKISPILDDLIEIGIDVFNPFQPEVMDVADLVQRYAGRLTFYGSLSIQKTLPFGNEEQVREEVRQRLCLARTFGGLIVSPSHDLPPDIPPANIAAMLDTLQSQ
jgi:uroporphyrinogen decarboxylase